MDYEQIANTVWYIAFGFACAIASKEYHSKEGPQYMENNNLRTLQAVIDGAMWPVTLTLNLALKLFRFSYG